ncbi:Telomere-binding protein cav [Eumeta japonica]|uniref:Telomere-binding protein cav n=1 Tax=Eumeta variegata TaxID=151549 RepID=A0A4C1SQ44_EUMVA|nr:Telomere-binding protein cav [Eumeta japonica]
MNSEDNSATHNYFIEYTKPTEEDLRRVFTNEELKELCLKTKCKIDIWRWNAVNDYRILFTQSGRFQRWSEQDRLRMLAKAVNTMKPSVLYDEEEIAKTRKRNGNFN